MGATSLTGTDTISISGRNLTDLGSGACVELTFPDDLATMKASKNGNTIIAYNNQGQVVDCSIRLLLGSSDDKYMNSLLQLQKQDISTFTLMTGVFSKRVGDGQGNLSTKVYQLNAGVFKKQPDAKTSSDGDPEQSEVVYMLRFGTGDPSIQ